MKIFNADEERFTIAWVLNKLEPPHWAATFVVKATFPLLPIGEGKWTKPPQPREATGPDMEGQGEFMESVTPNDFAPFKPRAEVILKATAYPPERQPVGAFACGFAMGTVNKTLHLFGPREFGEGLVKRSISDPKPVENMPIRWSLAYGGPGYPANPIGLGYNGGALPGIEYANQPVTKPGGDDQPAGLGPTSPTWSPRHKLQGTYRKKWLKTRWPWYPEDLDMAYFNDAPLDQQFAGYLRGNEAFEAINLHPVHSKLQGALPGLTPRVIYEDKLRDEDSPTYREIKLNLDTVFIDLEEELLCVAWRGATRVATHKMREVRHLLLATEPFDQPRSESYYRDDLIQRIRENEPQLAEVDDIQEKVNAAEAAIKQELSDAEAEMADAKKWAENLEKEERSKMDQLVEDQMKDQTSEKARAEYAQAKANPPAPRPPNWDEPGQSITTDEMRAKVGPKLEQAKQFAAENQAKVDGLDQQFKEANEAADQAEKKILTEIAVGLNAAYAKAGMVKPLEDGEEPSVLPGEEITREKVEWLLANRKPISLVDMNGLDLSGLDFSGLEIAMAKFGGANLTEANFERATFIQCSFTEAIIQNTNFTRASFSRCSLDLTDWTETPLNDGVTLELSSLRQSNFAAQELARWTCQQADFTGSNLEETKLVEAQLNYPVFDECSGLKANVDQCQLTGASFAGADFTEASFVQASISNLRADQKTSFTEANFTEAKGKAPIFAQADLTGAQFVQADFEGAVFSEARAAGADFSFAKLAAATFDEAMLERANFVYANLIRASFQYAQLRQTDFAGANLYYAGFLDARVDDIDLSGANIRHTLLANFVLGKYPVSLDLPDPS